MAASSGRCTIWGLRVLAFILKVGVLTAVALAAGTGATLALRSAGLDRLWSDVLASGAMVAAILLLPFLFTRRKPTR